MSVSPIRSPVYNIRDGNVLEGLTTSREIDFFLLTGEHPDSWNTLNLFPFVGESEHSAKRGEFTIDRCRAYSSATSDHILRNSPFVYPVNPCVCYGSEFEKTR